MSVRAALARATRLEMFASLHERDFRLLVVTTVLLDATRWMDVLVVGWLVLELTDSPALVGAAGAFRSFGWLLGPVGGLLADRFNRRHFLLLAAALNLAQAALLLSLYLLGQLQVWQIFSLALVNSILFGLDFPARQAFIADLVGPRTLSNAIALNRVANNIPYVLGPLLAGSFLSLFAFPGAYGLIVAMHAANVLLFLLISHRPRLPRPQRESVWGDVVTGVRHILKNQAAWLLLSLAVVANLLGRPYLYTMLPVFARDILGLGPGGLGVLMAATGVGSVLGSLWVAAQAARVRQGLVMMACYLLWAVTLGLFAVSGWYGLSLLLLIGVGAANAVAATLGTTLLLKAVPPELRGRVMGARAMVIVAMLPGMMLLGMGAEAIGAPATLALNSVAYLGVILAFVIAYPQLRRLT